MILINKRFTVVFLLLAVLLVSWQPVQGADQLTDAVIGFLPQRQLYRVAIVTPGGVEEYVYQAEFRIDADTRQLRASTDGPGYTMESRYDGNLRLLNSEMVVLNSEDAARVGFDHRVAAYDTVEGKYVLVFYLEGKLQDTREVYLQEQATEIEVLGLHLQALLNQGRTDFHGLMLDLNAPGRYKLDARVLTEKQVQALAELKNMAPQVKSMLENPEQITVFSIGYDGILRFFFPTRFHVVLEKTAPHRVLAYWAGSGERLRFHVYEFLE